MNLAFFYVTLADLLSSFATEHENYKQGVERICVGCFWYVYRCPGMVQTKELLMSCLAHLSGICLQYKRPRFKSQGRKIHWRRKWQPTPVLLPGESPWTEEPGGLVHGVARVENNLATKPSPGVFKPPCSVKGGWGCPKWATCKSHSCLALH